MNPEWHRVSKHEPCPICQHTDWCMLSNDGNVAICQRVESDHPTKNSGGWVHRLREREVKVKGEEKVKVKGEGEQRNDKPSTVHLHLSPSPHLPHHLSPSPSPEDIAAYFATLPTTKDNLQDRMCGYLERELGLPKEILLALDWRWDHKAKAVAIPMRDAAGIVTGIRYRALKSGAKWAKRGSKDGLFFDPYFIPYDVNELMVCEGPTDQAAAMACGFWCVGRSSCATGRDLIRAFAKDRHIHRVTIFSDFDTPKPRPGGGTWCPGQEGAERLGRELRLPYRIVYPPTQFKDLREWYRAGTLTSESLDQAVRGSSWRGPTFSN